MKYMIEKLKEKKGNYIPRREVIACVKEIVDLKKSDIVVGEVGVDMGGTAVEIIPLLNKTDEYYFFDYDLKINELKKDFEKINVKNVKLFGYGNTNKVYDSYAWNIAKLYKSWREEYGNTQRFDVVYIDGAHTFLHDSSATCILKEMVCRGGYLIFDDLNWSISTSPTINFQLNKSVLEKYPIEQIEACQVRLVTEIFMDTDARYQLVSDKKAGVGIYKRLK